MINIIYASLAFVVLLATFAFIILKSIIMQHIKFFSGENIPLELHKARVVQKINLVPIERRMEALYEAGFNTFKLTTKDVFLDMLTDS